MHCLPIKLRHRLVSRKGRGAGLCSPQYLKKNKKFVFTQKFGTLHPFFLGKKGTFSNISRTGLHSERVKTNSHLSPPPPPPLEIPEHVGLAASYHKV